MEKQKEMLRAAIRDSGLKIGFIIRSAGITTGIWYKRLRDWKWLSEEVTALSRVLHLTSRQTRDIFF